MNWGAGLLERQRELETIDARIAGARAGDGGVILIEGAPGLGKTSLAAAASRAAAAAGMRVLRAAGAELEQDLGWAVARELLHEPLSGPAATRLLTGAARAAAPLFDPVPPEAAGDSAGAIMHGLYWLIADLAAEQPVAIVVDDFHWVDAASARWLAYLGRRLADLPVLAVVASRPLPASRAWAALARSGPVLAPAPLSPDGTHALVAARLGDEASPELADACHEATAGNPFLVVELLATVGVTTSQTPEQIRALRPETIRRSVLLRLAQLGAHATDLCFAIAVLGHEATVALAARLASLPGDAAAGAADALLLAGVIRADPRLEFGHPVIRGVVQSEIPPAQRAAWHRRAAELLSERGATPATLAPHLRASEPDADASVVLALRAAATDALAIGAPEMAVSCLRRALAEPPPAGELATLLLELGRAEGLIGAPEAVEHLQAALAHAGDARERAQVALTVAPLLIGRGQVGEAARLCHDTARELPLTDRDLQLELLACARIAEGQQSHLDSTRLDRLHAEVATLAGETRGERMLLAAIANVRLRLPLPEIAELAERALSGTRLLDELTADSQQFWTAASTLLFAERYDVYAQLIRAAADESRQRGSPRGYGHCVCFGTVLAYRLGRLDEALDAGRRAAALFADDPLLACFSLSFLLEALIDRGALGEAHSRLEAAGTTALPDSIAAGMLRGSRARLLRAQGNPAAAIEELSAIAPCFDGVPPVFWPWHAEAALAAEAAGERGRAVELARAGLEAGELAGSRWAQALALHALALAEDSLEPLRRAEALTRGWPTLLERARVLAELGAGLRRRGRSRESEPVLREALELADRCGALPIAERAREELRIGTGARPRRAQRSGVDSLTPSELRVSRMAAGGSTNREIAQALFISLRTVETHLTRAYQKLSIGTREQLGPALGVAAANGHPPELAAAAPAAGRGQPQWPGQPPASNR